MRTFSTFLLGVLAFCHSSGAATVISGDEEVVSAELNSLLLTVRWSNNLTAVAKLSAEEEEYCIFPGKFLLDQESEVLVTGCVSDAELSVQFQSQKFGDQLFTLKDGVVSSVDPDDLSKPENEPEIEYPEIDLPYEGPSANPGSNGRFRREDYYDYDSELDLLISEDFDDLPDLGDYEVDDGELPVKVELQISVYLDPAFKKLHGNQATSLARQIISQVSLLMKHSSLTTKIELVHGNRFFTSNTHLGFSSIKVASQDLLVRLPKLLKQPFTVGGHPVCHVYFTVPDGGSVKGVAQVASLCAPNTVKDKPTKQPRALVVWNKDKSTTAVTLAHEIGHIFGMFHDFDKGHSTDRTSKTCAVKHKGEFILNYGNSPRRSLWSTCSNEDFKSYYFKVLFGASNGHEYCLKATIAGACAFNEWRCRSGTCIPESQRCDGLRRNCPDGDDETACPFDPFDY
eukprot:GFUD01110403.1.p1 GENE.GFUD01110403.1~~GFUD01110403.1.p1  ORF type:complete len:456 (+),score=61.55 GFUD01110403.1:116-1483(+)